MVFACMTWRLGSAIALRGVEKVIFVEVWTRT